MSLMLKEAQQTPEKVAQQYATNADVLTALADHLAKQPVNFAMTIARGSSDHAATFAKYAFETQLNLVTSSAAPSVATIYHADLALTSSLVVGISQSGKSEDICTMMQIARDNGAITVALVNDIESPLANIAEYCIDLCAGPELAVAATKSYITSLTAICYLTAVIKKDRQLLAALERLPDYLTQALQCDWQSFIEYYQTVQDTIVIGRGYGFPIAQESALKFKETCAIHAESFSSAEFLHGPFALVKNQYPIFCYAQDGPSYSSVIELIEKSNAIGADTFLAAPNNLTQNNLAKYYLPLPNSLHPLCDPIMAIQAFYPAIAQLAVNRGCNPDQPENLQKVTSTK